MANFDDHANKLSVELGIFSHWILELRKFLLHKSGSGTKSQNLGIKLQKVGRESTRIGILLLLLLLRDVGTNWENLCPIGTGQGNDRG